MKETESGSGVSLFGSTEECEDAGGGGVYLGQTDEDGVFITDPSPSSVFLGTEGWILQTPPPPHCGTNDSESEDVFTTINPNEIFAESDSSEVSDSTHCQIQAPPTIYQVVYDISGVGVGQEEQQKVDVISIDLDEWSAPVLMADGCLVGELPLVSAVKVEQSHPEMSCSTHGHTQSNTLLYPELSLTEEEQKLLSQEGISLPNNLPLTKAEERLLKKVRRKIRNKQSAQDSRRRKKEYIDGLESKVAACSTQNKELQRTVDQLEKHNMSLLAQLRKLQALVKQTVSKAAQTSTCLLILIVSLTLIIFPSYGPFRWRSSASDDPYTPTGVISRNILNDAAAPLPSDGSADDKKIPVDVQSSPDQSDMDEFEIDDAEQEDVELKSNDTAVLETRAEPLDVDLPPPPAGGAALDVEAVKPAHADEM